MDESKVIVLAREAGLYDSLGCEDCGFDEQGLKRFTELLSKEKATEIAELYQMCLNQAMTIKKYQDKYGSLE